MESLNLDDLVDVITPENMQGFVVHAQKVGAEQIEW